MDEGRYDALRDEQAAENSVNHAKRGLIGCSLAVGAATFFWLGTLVPQRAEHWQEAGAHPISTVKPSSQPSVRKIFSPSIRDDPYAVQQWRQAVEALEKRCRDANEFCVEARNARLQVREIE